MQEVVITYETLYDILQREKDKPDLQKLEPSFFTDIIGYIKDKKKLLDSKEDSIFAKEERKKTERQLENIHKIVKDIYEKREKKIIGMALDRSRTKSNLIDTTALLNEEKALFDAITSVLNSYRDAIIVSVINEKIPFMSQSDVKLPDRNFRTALEIKKADGNIEPDNLFAENTTDNTKLVRFLGHVPKFVGTELEEYGPFEGEDIANLPSQIADILIGKGIAEEISKI